MSKGVSKRANKSQPPVIDEMQSVGEYARTDVPRLVGLCMRLTAAVPPENLEPYAAAIGKDTTAADTLQQVARSLAISEDSNVRSFLTQILKYCSPDDEMLVGILQWLTTDNDERVSDDAYITLGHLYGTSNLVAELANSALESRFSHLRVAGIRILANTETNSKVVATMLALLRDKNWRVREIAARALGKSANKRAITPLLKLLKDDDDDVRQSAIEALGQLGALQASKQLFSILRNE